PDLRNLHVDSDAVEYAPGQPVRVSVRLLGRDYQPLAGGAVSLVVKRGADPMRPTQISDAKITVGDDGTAVHHLRGPSPGVDRVEGTATIGGRRVHATDICRVREGGTELDRPVGGPATLESIARATPGVALGPADLLPLNLPFDPPRIVRVDRRTDVELWSR